VSAIKTIIRRPGYPTEYEKQQLLHAQREELQRYKNMLQWVYEDPTTPLGIKCVISDFWAIKNRSD